MPRAPFLASFLPAFGALLLPAATAAPAPAQTTTAPEPAWQANLTARRQQLIASNGPGTDAALRTDLLTMRDQDQTARGLRPAPGAAPGQSPAIATNLTAIDAALTAHLKTIVQQHGWPTIALVGIDASDAAMLLLTHTADLAWRRSLLPQLENLADLGKIDGAPLAAVIDKQLVAEGKPQRYGTQFQSTDDGLAMIQVEDPGGLDSLRARTLLPPIEIYRAQLARMYHLKPSNRIAGPTPPAASAQ